MPFLPQALTQGSTLIDTRDTWAPKISVQTPSISIFLDEAYAYKLQTF